MNTQSNTPETDKAEQEFAVNWRNTYGNPIPAVGADFARKLERQRDALRADLARAHEALKDAPIHRFDEGRTVFIERYQKWYREQRNSALATLNETLKP